MNDLGARYRDALRWYPKKWRSANEDAVLGTLLDIAEHDHRSAPARGELRNLRANALTTRLGLLGRSIPSNVKQRAATLAMGLGVAISAAGLVYGGLAYQLGSHGRLIEYFSLATFEFNASSTSIYIFWIGAFITALLGFRRTSGVLLVLSLGSSVVWPLLTDTLVHGHPGALTSGYLDMLAVVALLGLSSRPTPRRRALAISSVLFAIALLAAYELNKSGYWGDGAVNIDEFWSPLSVWLIWLGLPLAVVLAIVLRVRRRGPWSAAILLAAAPTLPLSLLAFLTSRSIIFSGIGSAAVAIVFVALILAALKLFGLRIRITRT